jgi:glycosyltransferase involved in cell wall biosynthesis
VIGQTGPVAQQANATRPPLALIVHDSLVFNGAVRLSLGLAERWRRRGSRLAIYALQPVRDGHEASPEAETELVRGVPPGGRLRTSGAAALARLLRAARRADVVVSGSEVGLGLLLGYTAARVGRKPYAIQVHADLDAAVEQWVPRRLRALTRFVHRHADAAFCVSEDVARGVVANGIAPERVRVIPAGIDLERLRRFRRDRRAPSPTPTVVAIGRLSREKGFDFLLHAHSRVLKGGQRHQLVIFGEGPARADLEELARRLTISDSVHLEGFVDDPTPTLALADADVFVLPSLREGVPLALLEALALRIPVLATRSGGGVEEALGHGRYGELVEAESVSELADALGRCLQHGSNGAQVPEEHLENYSLDHVADLHGAALRELVDGSKKLGVDG